MSLAVVVVGLAHGLAPIFGGVMMGKLGVILGAVVGLIIVVNNWRFVFSGCRPSWGLPWVPGLPGLLQSKIACDGGDVGANTAHFWQKGKS